MQQVEVFCEGAAPARGAQADLGDSYVPYNKPGSIKHWLEHANVTEDFVFFIDADMARPAPSCPAPAPRPRPPPKRPSPSRSPSRQLFLHRITPDMVNATKGHAVSAAYDYLIGVDDPLMAPKFLAEQYRPLMRKVGWARRGQGRGAGRGFWRCAPGLRRRP